MTILKKNLRSILLIVNTLSLFGAICIPYAYADNIHLKNGIVLTGEVIEQVDDYLEVQLKTAKAKFNLSDVESVEKCGLPEGFFAQEQPAAKDALNKAEVSAAQKEGYSKPPEPPKARPKVARNGHYKIDAQATYKKENGQDLIYADGTTNLPDGVSIYVFLKRLDRVITFKREPVKDGRFYASFGPFEKKLLAADYTIAVEFMPETEPVDIAKKVRRLKIDKISTSCSLPTGTPDEIMTNEESCKARINSSIIELQALYGELNNTYLSSRNNFDGDAWDKWSEDWLSKANALKDAIRNSSQSYVVLAYPKSQDNIWLCVQQIILLNKSYSTELKDPGKLADRINNPEIYMPDSSSIKESFGKLLAEAQQEVIPPLAKAEKR